PYVNAEPHIGFAMEIIRADIIARTKKLAGYEVFFNTGTDEHGTKIYRKAKDLGIETQAYVDGLADKYKNLLGILGIMPEVNFVRTTDAHHKMAAQEFWKKVDQNGFIYKKNYEVKYCVGCELEKTESELINSRCPLHPAQELEIIKEENYFFKASAFEKKLLELYAANPTLVVPDFRFNEIKALIGRGFQDFSISRLVTKMPWGIPVPGDESQVMYVWFDALVNYISAVGWFDDSIAGKIEPGSFEKWWVQTGGVVQYCGKDNLRQQSAMWQAMLMAAELPPSKTIVINGFITGEGGLKMSKSLGNTVDPLDLVKEYGTDALRYYVARELSMFEDSPFTIEKFKEGYNAHLANGIGNLTSRILKMADTNNAWIEPKENPVDWKEIDEKLSGFEISKFCTEVWDRIIKADKYIADTQPFKMVKVDTEGGVKAIQYLLEELWVIAHLLAPILPATSEAVKLLIVEKKLPGQPLFMRK
ncbi:MAG: methionine--tRNA ligase, partial [bacterium]|nr:methionine--tRNA ligase [bacterium]